MSPILDRTEICRAPKTILAPVVSCRVYRIIPCSRSFGIWQQAGDFDSPPELRGGASGRAAALPGDFVVITQRGVFFFSWPLWAFWPRGGAVAGACWSPHPCRAACHWAASCCAPGTACLLMSSHLPHAHAAPSGQAAGGQPVGSGVKLCRLMGSRCADAERGGSQPLAV